MPSPRRFLAVVLVMLAAAGVLAATATVVRHNSARAAATVGAVAASASPTPTPAQPPPRPPRPTRDIAGYGDLREGATLSGKVAVVITLRPGVHGPVHFSLTGPHTYTPTDGTPPYTFPPPAHVWNTRAVVNGHWTLAIRVGSGGVQQRIHFVVHNPGR